MRAEKEDSFLARDAIAGRGEWSVIREIGWSREVLEGTASETA